MVSRWSDSADWCFLYNFYYFDKSKHAYCIQLYNFAKKCKK